MVRLLPVSERYQQLFGTETSAAVPDWLETGGEAATQGSLFADSDLPPMTAAARRGARNTTGSDPVLYSAEATVLDRVHGAMLLQAGGHSNALRKLILSERERGPDFLRLANALSALYPPASREKRLLDAMLLATR